jgi:hypothetical protein
MLIVLGEALSEEALNVSQNAFPSGKSLTSESRTLHSLDAREFRTFRLFGGSCATGSDHRRPQQPAEARLAGAGGAHDRRSGRHQRDHAADGARQGLGLALAGALHRGGRRRAVARQDPTVADSQAFGRESGRGDPPDAGGGTAGWWYAPCGVVGSPQPHSVDGSGASAAFWPRLLQRSDEKPAGLSWRRPRACRGPRCM